MSNPFKRALPSSRNLKQIGENDASIKSELYEKLTTQNSRQSEQTKNALNIMGLVDATGSMTDFWSFTLEEDFLAVLQLIIGKGLNEKSFEDILTSLKEKYGGALPSHIQNFYGLLTTGNEDR